MNSAGTQPDLDFIQRACAGKRVMIVDDAAFMRMMLGKLLTEQGLKIAGEAEDGFEAVEVYGQCLPDIVTMDITMPRCNGVDAVRELCARFPSPRIIMVSAMGQKLMVIEAMQAGARDFIVKPFKPERVMQAVYSALTS